MTEPRRLFDCLNYHLERKPIPDMFSARINGIWKSFSTREVKDIVDQLSAGLLSWVSALATIASKAKTRLPSLPKTDLNG